MNPKNKELQYRPDVDGLRAIAIASVVAFHAGLLGFSGGYVGVDVFFVISGFLITHQLMGEARATQTLSFLNFYSRRVKRLFPLILLVIFSALAFWSIFLLGIPDETANFIHSIRYALFGFANIYFMKSAGNYFTETMDQLPFLHFWSLGIEEQFYLFWPLLILLITKASLRFYSLAKIFVSISLLLIVGSLFYSQYQLLKHHPLASFYLIFSRAWELAVGGLLIFLRKDRFKFNITGAKISHAIGTLGLLLIIGSVCFYTKETLFPGLLALPPVIGTALILLSFEFKRDNLVSRFLGSMPMVKVGLLSYAWYLWHWPLLSFATIWRAGEQPEPFTRLLLVALSFGLAVLSHYFYERPIKNYLKTISPKKTIIAAASIALFIVILGSGVSRYEEYHHAKDWGREIGYVAERSSIYPRCQEDGELDTKDCSLSFGEKETELKNTIFVWGDSHAYADFPMVEEFAKRKKIKAILYSRNGLPSLLGPTLFWHQESKKNKGPDSNDSFLEDMKTIIKNNPKVSFSVILASRWMQHAGIKPISLRDPIRYLDIQNTEAGSRTVLAESLDFTLQQLFKIGVKKVMIILPYPEFKFDFLSCIMRSNHKCATPREEMDHYRATTVKTINEVSARYNEVRTVDPVPVFCDATLCPQMINLNGSMIPVVRDHDHASASAIRMFGNAIHDDLDWLVSE